MKIQKINLLKKLNICFGDFTLPPPKRIKRLSKILEHFTHVSSHFMTELEIAEDKYIKNNEKFISVILEI